MWDYDADLWFSCRYCMSITPEISITDVSHNIRRPRVRNLWTHEVRPHPTLSLRIHTHIYPSALFIWAFYPETTGRRLEEMDALFEDAPIFVPGTEYTRMKDHYSAERELRQGQISVSLTQYLWITGGKSVLLMFFCV